MSSINLYKMDGAKVGLFKKTLKERMTPIKETINYVEKDEELDFEFALYTKCSGYPKPLKWNWLLNEFKTESIRLNAAPQAVLLAQEKAGALYAITFGHSFFMVDKYCDRDFGFSVARRMDFDEIKTTTLTTPNSKRNKTVNTYIDYSELEFDSGESFAKIKVKASLPDDFNLFKASVEIGTSIRVTTEEDSLSCIAHIIRYIEKVILTKDEKYKIPVFSKVKDDQRIQLLEQHLREQVLEKPEICISELDIIGVTEVFNRNDDEFVLKYSGKTKRVESLTSDEIEKFCQENNWEFKSVVLDIAVESFCDGHRREKSKVKDLIDFTDDDERCLLSRGVWYQYNDDYLSYLKDSISEITAEYHPEYDLSKEMHDRFIESLLKKEILLPENIGKDVKKLRAALKNKYYYERLFNIVMERDHGFKNYDRDGREVDGMPVEISDLYKDQTMYSVKVGNASSKLCYAVDQSLGSLYLYKHNLLPNMPQINSVGIWLILERKKHIEENGVPNINLLEMLLLKNKLDHWKKEVRLQGFKPIIFINYKT